MGAPLHISKLPGVGVASKMLGASADSETWCCDTLTGRFVEISGASGTAALSTIAGLIFQAQQHGGLAAWIGSRRSVFFPPDFAASGIDLRALPVIHSADTKQAARIADRLLRSNGFAIVVLDLGHRPRIPLAVQTRLAGLAKKHHSALIAITRKKREDPSLGPLISLRGEANKERAFAGSFTAELRVIRDKRHRPGWGYKGIFRGPAGLC